MEIRIVKRFWESVTKSETCWTWNNYKNSKGYGSVTIMENGKRKNYKAHRLSWIITNGKIPEGLVVCHKCDNPPCVNPEHLFLGTIKDNNQDMMNKGRYNHYRNKDKIIRAKRSCEYNGSFKLTEIQVMEIRSKYDKKTCNSRHLSLMYNVHKRTISKILSGQRWNNNSAPA